MVESGPRRRFRASRMLVTAAMLAVLAGALAFWVTHRQRVLVIADIVRSGGAVRGEYEGPTWLGRMLRITHDKLRPTASPGPFDTIRRVVYFNASNLRDADLGHLARLERCRSVHLEEIQLHGASSITDGGIAHFRGLATVERLWLSGTSATDEGLRFLSRLKGLRLLELRGTPITGKGLRYLQGLGHLDVLDLGDTAIDDEALVHVGAMRNLEHIYLFNHRCGGMVSDAGLENLRELSRLRGLYLYGTNVTDAGLEHLKGLAELETLALNYTKVTDEGISALLSLKKLRVLDLEGTRVTDAGVPQLQALKRLERLSLDDTAVTDEAVAELRSRLPMCQIRNSSLSGRPECKAASTTPHPE